MMTRRVSRGSWSGLGRNRQQKERKCGRGVQMHGDAPFWAAPVRAPPSDGHAGCGPLERLPGLWVRATPCSLIRVEMRPEFLIRSARGLPAYGLSVFPQRLHCTLLLLPGQRHAEALRDLLYEPGWTSSRGVEG